MPRRRLALAAGVVVLLAGCTATESADPEPESEGGLALTIETAEPLWTYTLPGDAGVATTAHRIGTVTAVHASDAIIGLGDTGEELWRFDEATTSVDVLDGYLIADTGATHTAIAADTGEPAADIDSSGTGFVYGGVAVIPTADGVAGWHPDTGTVWQANLPDSALVPWAGHRTGRWSQADQNLAGASGRVLVSYTEAGESMLAAIDPRTGDVTGTHPAPAGNLWQVSADGYVTWSADIDTVQCATELAGHDIDTGETVWGVQLSLFAYAGHDMVCPETVDAEPVLSGGRLLGGHVDQQGVMIDAGNGEATRVPPGGLPVAFADGVVVTRSDDGLGPATALHDAETLWTLELPVIEAPDAMAAGYGCFAATHAHIDDHTGHDHDGPEPEAETVFAGLDADGPALLADGRLIDLNAEALVTATSTEVHAYALP
ncbi:hypothetical protein LX16_4112 [Stackebrandtia albiflava]|uniref:Pyrroloquinoline-quinone binding quinoprotein n=1 Tax=Stackebrandtia albiflava TaxID=406432 RepID=A0A562UYJ9_9ACTN|nr:hypothetical protein LX16_4112 [Stackebrandtia albiflava]